MAEPLQHEAAPQRIGIPTTGPRDRGPVAGRADHELTFKPDQSSGAGQILDNKRGVEALAIDFRQPSVRKASHSRCPSSIWSAWVKIDRGSFPQLPKLRHTLNGSIPAPSRLAAVQRYERGRGCLNVRFLRCRKVGSRLRRRSGFRPLRTSIA